MLHWSLILRSFLEDHVEAAQHDDKQAVKDNSEDDLLGHAAVIVVVATTAGQQSLVALDETQNRRLFLHFDFLYYYKIAISRTINI